jgi:hypothetical protein
MKARISRILQRLGAAPVANEPVVAIRKWH